MNYAYRPLFVIYVLWHSDFAMGKDLAEDIRSHFRRQLQENVAGGHGLSVIFRSVLPPGSAAPMEIDLNEARATAVIVLTENTLAADEAWKVYIQQISRQTHKAGLHTRMFPVSIDHDAVVALAFEEQSFRWSLWVGDLEEKRRRLLSDLTYECCRMLRHLYTALRHPEKSEDALDAYLKKVQIFISHSKHDNEGIRVASAIREHLHKGTGLSSFFDVHDIPVGLRAEHVLLEAVKVSAVVAVHSDSYSSREWCRREVIEAKRHHVPLVVANAIHERDERVFPYMGNVPVIRLDPVSLGRIDFLISCLLDEVLKDFLWRCRVLLAKGTASSSVIFVPRSPELITLACLPPISEVPQPIIVYPDPPLSDEEELLFEAVAPHVQLRSLNEWISGAIR